MAKIEKQIKKLIEFIDKIKNDEKWVGDEYECYNVAYQYLNYLSKALKPSEDVYTNRRDLEYDLNIYLDEYNESLLDEKGFGGLEDYEYDDLYKLNDEICKEFFPIWQDNSNCYNLKWLIDHYDLNIDELYFDGSSNCIRDEDGNIWAD